MQNKKYSCPNGCKQPPRKKQLIELSDGTYTFSYHDFRFCPCCGALMPTYLKKLQDFFDVYDLHPKLQEAKRLLLKSEFEAAVRESVVVLENGIKEKANLPDLHGKDLVSKAFRMEYDKPSGTVKTEPLIAINNLETESDRNEQEGCMMMLMGFFQGTRNLVQHNHLKASFNLIITQIIETSYFLYLIEGKSLLKGGHWIRSKTSLQDIYCRMPKKIDRIKLSLLLKRHVKN